MIPLFDLHCDTIGECYKEKASLRKNNFSVSLEKGKVFENYTQVFAIWIPDELRGQKAKDYFNKVCNYYNTELSLNRDLVIRYAPETKNDKRIKAILAVEGGAVLGGDAEEIYNIYERGVRLMTLTWNKENEIASGAFCEDGGLTEFGKSILRKMEKLKMVIDVSHLNRQSFFDVAEESNVPFIASHSNPDIVENPFGKKRNLNDEQIKIIKERSGLIGINFCKDFLESDKKGFEAINRHLCYLLDKGCENVIALGSDFDGCTLAEGITGLESMKSLYEFLLQKGYDEKMVADLFYNNANRFFSHI